MAHKLTRRRFWSGGIDRSFALAGCSPKEPRLLHLRWRDGTRIPATVAQYGLAVRSGNSSVSQEFNKKGGVNGRQIVSIVEDEKGRFSTKAILVYNKLLTRTSAQFW